MVQLSAAHNISVVLFIAAFMAEPFISILLFLFSGLCTASGSSYFSSVSRTCHHCCCIHKGNRIRPCHPSLGCNRRRLACDRWCCRIHCHHPSLDYNHIQNHTCCWPSAPSSQLQGFSLKLNRQLLLRLVEQELEFDLFALPQCHSVVFRRSQWASYYHWELESGLTLVPADSLVPLLALVLD